MRERETERQADTQTHRQKANGLLAGPQSNRVVYKEAGSRCKPSLRTQGWLPTPSAVQDPGASKTQPGSHTRPFLCYRGRRSGPVTTVLRNTFVPTAEPVLTSDIKIRKQMCS